MTRPGAAAHELQLYVGERRQLLRTGHIGLLFDLDRPAGAIALAPSLGKLLGRARNTWRVGESLIGGGGVAPWRSLEICLRDGRPLQAQARPCDRRGRLRVDAA